jgi:hypothetical protein
MVSISSISATLLLFSVPKDNKYETIGLDYSS